MICDKCANYFDIHKSKGVDRYVCDDEFICELNENYCEGFVEGEVPDGKIKGAYKELEEMLDRFKDSSDDNSYYGEGYNRTIRNDITGEEIEFEEELNKVMKNIGIKQYYFTYCGGFDSPGYDIDCYCISYIDLEGRLQTIPVYFELY